MAHVCFYARTSTLMQATGLESQIRALKSYAKASGIENYKLFTDEVSGRKSSRPGLDALMAEVKSGTASQVVVYSLSRFSRSVKHLLEALDILSHHGVAFVSLTESLNTSTPTGRAIITIISAIAQLESDLVKERVRNGLVNAKAKGKKLGRPSNVDRGLVAALLKQKMNYRQIAQLAKCSHCLIRSVVLELRQSEVACSNTVPSVQEALVS